MVFRIPELLDTLLAFPRLADQPTLEGVMSKYDMAPTGMPGPQTVIRIRAHWEKVDMFQRRLGEAPAIGNTI